MIYTGMNEISSSQGEELFDEGKLLGNLGKFIQGIFGYSCDYKKSVTNRLRSNEKKYFH